MMFDRFDICEAHALIESDYNVGGMLQERPSNQRRNESTSCQLARIGYRPSPLGGTYEHLTESGRAIYHELIRRYSLPWNLISDRPTR